MFSTTQQFAGHTFSRFLGPAVYIEREAQNLSIMITAEWVTSTGVGLAAVADTIVTAALTYSLHRSRTGFQRCVSDLSR